MPLLKSTILALGLALGLSLGFNLGPTMQVAHAGGPSVTSPSGGKPALAASEPVTKKAAAERAVTDCMLMWDAGTHMSKRDWARTCRRVQDRLYQFDAR